MKKNTFWILKTKNPFIYVNRNYIHNLEVTIGVDYNNMGHYKYGSVSYYSKNLKFFKLSFDDGIYKIMKCKNDDFYFDKLLETENMKTFRSRSKMVFMLNGNYYLAYFDGNYDIHKEQKEPYFKVIKFEKN